MLATLLYCVMNLTKEIPDFEYGLVSKYTSLMVVIILKCDTYLSFYVGHQVGRMDSCISSRSPGEAEQGVKEGLRPPSELFREVQKAAKLAKTCQVAVESASVPKTILAASEPGSGK